LDTLIYYEVSIIGNFLEKRAFHNLQNDEKEKILSYKLMVYACSGTESEKLEWFHTINIAGEKLTDQELRNGSRPHNNLARGR